MSEPIISVSGLRGIVGESLDPQVAMRYAAAFAMELPPGPLVITRDGRATGPMVVDAVRSALAAMGRDCLDGDVAATPTTGVLVRQHEAAGGIQVSASHNPPEYNGLKLFSATGCVVDAAAGERVLERYHGGQFAWVDHEALGQVRECEETTVEHLRLVLDRIDVDAVRARKFSVLLDSNHGAGSILGRQLLTELDCQVTLLGDTPDGRFAHPAEPTAANLHEVRHHVTDAKAAIGFCQDPDADRLAIIDEQGRYVGEEYTLALCLDHILRVRQGPIVTNCATSRMAQDLANQYGVDFHTAAVGEANVTALMRSAGAVFGGEGNGGPIDPQVGYVRDSFIGMALVLAAMAQRDLPVSKLADELPRYEIHKHKVSIERDRIPAALDALEKQFADAAANRMDGLRLDWDDRWLLVRASNTEPIVRIITEAKTAAAAQQLCTAAEEVINSAP